ncbi:MAG: LeoA/HP0731 family dynamin-like GTPase [Lentisphaeria bacterium]|jgi:GTPase SAR1 family protein
MKNFEFIEKSNELNNIRQQLMSFKSEALLKNGLDEIEKQLLAKDADSRLNIAVCGQYSAGKSTLVHALTKDETIKIGQDITTDEVKLYPWNDLLIADTPGIYAGRPEHDERSLDFIQKADLLIYMITIQGFTREIGANFKNLIMEKYQGKTMLLMNKRNQEPSENEANWRRDTILFLGNEELAKKLYFTIVDIEDYLVGTNENIPELIKESNFEEFISNLNLFIKKKELFGKLLSRINIMDAFLCLCIGDFSKREEKDDFTRRQKRAIAHALTDLNKATSESSLRIRQQIRDLSNRLAGLLTDETISEFNQEVGNSDQKLENILDDMKLQEDIKLIVEELRQTMEDIDLDASKYEQNLNELVKKIPNAEIEGVVDLSMFKTGALEVGKLASGATREGVTKIAHFFGHKFKPWGATKLTKFVKGVGGALALVGVAVDVITYAKDKKHQAELEQKRNSIRQNFREIEEGVKEQFEAMKNEDGSLFHVLNSTLEHLEKREQEQQKQAETKKDLAEKLTKIKQRLDQVKESIA